MCLNRWDGGLSDGIRVFDPRASTRYSDVIETVPWGTSHLHYFNLLAVMMENVHGAIFCEYHNNIFHIYTDILFVL